MKNDYILSLDLEALNDLSKKERKLEWRKCRFGPYKQKSHADGLIYFVYNYVKIVDKDTQEIIDFSMYPAQEDTLRELYLNKKVITLKSRQSGFTFLFLAFCCWRLVFFKNQRIAIISRDGKRAKEALSRLKIMLKELPIWMKPDKRNMRENMHEIFFLNTGSEVGSFEMSADKLRGGIYNIVFADEFAFIRDGVNEDELWRAMAPALEKGFGMLNSTPNGLGNLYYRIYHKATKGENNYKVCYYHWTYDRKRVGDKELFKKLEKRRRAGHPPPVEGDALYEELKQKSEWYKNVRKDYDDDSWEQEFDLGFLSSGRPVFNQKLVNKMVEYAMQFSDYKPIEYITTYEEPQEGINYIVTCDPASGSGGDYTAVGVFKEDGEQVAEFVQNKLPIEVYTPIIVELAKKYNNAFTIVERNNHGGTVLHMMLDTLGYYNVYIGDDGMYGFKTWDTKAFSGSKTLMIKDLRVAMNEGFIQIKSVATLEEFRVYAYDNKDHMNAPSGYHDDRVIMCALFTQALKGIIRLVD